MAKSYEGLDSIVENISTEQITPSKIEKEVEKLRSPNDIIYISNRILSSIRSGNVIYDSRTEPFLEDLIDEANEETRDLTTREYLTGLYNRKHLDDELEAELASLRRDLDRKTSIMIFDIDYFKRLNDGYGHVAGDSVLVTLSDIVSKNIRGSDIPFRYGGEEFSVLFRGACQTDALNATYELMKKITDKKMILVDKEGNENEESITISAGVVEMNSKISREGNIKHADELLYHVKENGRNNIAYMENGSIKMIKKN